MCPMMNQMCWQPPCFLLLLLLAVGANHQDAAASSEEQARRLTALWKLHIRDTLTRGHTGHPHPAGRWNRKQLLYCRVGIGFHLQILPNGSVRGVHEPTEYSWLKVFATKRGVVGIRGVESGLYLCLSADGRAYGAEKFSDDCMLRENLEENHYNTYSSVSHPHPPIYLALSHKGGLKSGKGLSHHHRSTHFLPRTER